MKKLLVRVGIHWFTHSGALQIEVREWPLYLCWALDGQWTLADTEGRPVPVRFGYYRLHYAHVVVMGRLSIRLMDEGGQRP